MSYLTVALSFCTAIMCIITTTFGSQRFPLYVDNGLDQTTIDHIMTMEEKNEIEADFLHLLGLPHRPRKIDRKALNKSAARFLLDVYQQIIQEEEDDEEVLLHRRFKRDLVQLSGEEQRQIEECDVIMTLETNNDHIKSLRHERGRRIWFDTSEIPIDNTIVNAEIKIYQNGSVDINTDYEISAYQLISSEGERELEYISSVKTVANYTGWLRLNVTVCLLSWLENQVSNKGLYLSVHLIGKPEHEIRSEKLGLITDKRHEASQPFMVVFMKSTNQVQIKRSIRSVRIRKSTQRSFTLDNYKYVISDDRNACQLYNFYVNFKDLNWQDWVIAPPGYHAYYCAGECNFPLNSKMNASNHAIVQSLVHLMYPHRYPKPCCAPNKLIPIRILYSLDGVNVIMKKYKNMVVKTCGCI